MLSLRFLSAAEADIHRVHSFLAEIDPIAATKAIDAILDNVDLLRTHPGMGRRFESHPLLRHWTVQFGSAGYVIQYGVSDETLFVTRIWHSREDR